MSAFGRLASNSQLQAELPEESYKQRGTSREVPVESYK